MPKLTTEAQRHSFMICFSRASVPPWLTSLCSAPKIELTPPKRRGLPRDPGSFMFGSNRDDYNS